VTCAVAPPGVSSSAERTCSAWSGPSQRKTVVGPLPLTSAPQASCGAEHRPVIVTDGTCEPDNCSDPMLPDVVSGRLAPESLVADAPTPRLRGFGRIGALAGQDENRQVGPGELAAEDLGELADRAGSERLLGQQERAGAALDLVAKVRGVRARDGEDPGL